MHKRILFFLLFLASGVQGQHKEDKGVIDSLFIQEVENSHKTDKVLHAEPLFIDLIRDLGARKGEREWNMAFGLTDNTVFDQYTALVEYEWAPLNRLGLEVELPFSFYDANRSTLGAPTSKLNSIKLAAQYSFFVSEQHKTSMAIGYIHEFEMTEFKRYNKENIFNGNLFNPFFVAAKRWGSNYHTLLYAGPSIVQHHLVRSVSTTWQLNSNLHYMIPGTRNFVGLEFNKEFRRGDFDMTIRPQMRVGLSHNLMVGIVSGVPIRREKQRFSSFLRLIYEPGVKKDKV
jgi:hypothetical protein